MWNHPKSWQNQNIYFRVSEKSDQCWYSIQSSPSSGSKKAVYRFQSVNSIVKTPSANTGRDSNMAMIRTNHMNNSVWYWDMAGVFINSCSNKIDNT